MKVGSKNRTTLIVAVVLMAIAIGSLIWAFSSSSSPAPVATTSASGSARPATAPARTTSGKPTDSANSIDPTLHLDLLKASEDIEYLGKGRNIFRAQAEAPVEIPKPVIDPRKEAQARQAEKPAPPPILLKFFGFANRTGETKKIFLSQSDDIFVAAEGDIVKGRYKILRINPNSIEVEDVLNNNRQSIPLTQS